MLSIKVLPANGGDCLLVSFGEEGCVKNILIDGGIGATYNNVLRDEISNIKEAQQSVDLLVLTHSHADHINGIIKFIEDDERNDCIKKIWFNSGVHFNREKVEMLTQSDEDETNISLNKIKYLEDKLIEMKYMDENIWNNELVKQGDTLAFYGATITVLSPDEHGLEALREFTTEPTDETNIAGGEYDFSTRLSEFNLDAFQEDSSTENSTSISFMFEYDSKRVLFLADSFPSVVLEGLEKTGLLKSSNKVDYLKLAHHGSRRNLSNELLESISCSNYIVSTYGMSANRLPNKEVFARILNCCKAPRLYFNYKNEMIEDIFYDDEIEGDDYKIDRVYLEDNHYNIKVLS